MSQKTVKVPHRGNGGDLRKAQSGRVDMSENIESLADLQGSHPAVLGLPSLPQHGNDVGVIRHAVNGSIAVVLDHVTTVPA